MYQLKDYIPYPLETIWPAAFLPFSLLYKFIPKFRAWEEIQCYKRQLESDKPEDKDRKASMYAEFVTGKYNVTDLDFEEVKRKIMS